MRLHAVHVVSALVGFAGAALAILGKPGTAPGFSLQFEWGYVLALAAAFIWSSYSLMTRRVAVFPTSAIGSFAALSGLLALACHTWLEPATPLSTHDWLLIAAMGLGPLGGAFFLWDAALKTGDPRKIGLLSFLTPLLSTGMLLITQGKPLTWHVALAAALIIGAAVIGSRARD
jgi:drug/metabolite transporter (DMT)-like permease